LDGDSNAHASASGNLARLHGKRSKKGRQMLIERETKNAERSESIPAAAHPCFATKRLVRPYSLTQWSHDRP
jgi:hypothetical protein